MQGKPIAMRHVREVLRLKASGASINLISRCVGIARSTAGDVIKRAGAAGLAWPLPEEITDAGLAAALFKLGRCDDVQKEYERVKDFDPKISELMRRDFDLGEPRP